MDGHARANQLKPSGIAHKELVVKNHLLPVLGAKRLDAIADEDVAAAQVPARSSTRGANAGPATEPGAGLRRGRPSGS